MCVEFLFVCDSISQLASNFQNVKSLSTQFYVSFYFDFEMYFYCTILSCSICHLIRRKYAAQKKMRRLPRYTGEIPGGTC